MAPLTSRLVETFLTVLKKALDHGAFRYHRQYKSLEIH